MAVLTETTQDILGRMLRRLPASLWDTDPASETLQRDIYRAVAEQLAVWLEQFEIANAMTLLREADGVDLDVLLADYGLKRYLQRPDDIARQVAMQILWSPKGHLRSEQLLADLLFDQEHVTMRTGRSHVHVFLAASQPITTPYSYWGLVSQDGLWYAVTIDAEVPVISQAPPPGLNVAPGPHTLHWFTVLDASSAVWYVTIQGDTLRVSQVQPLGYGTAVPFAVLDGQGNRWTLSVDAGSEALVTTLDQGLSAFGYWQLSAPGGLTYHLYIEAEVPTISTTAPAGGVAQTPGGSPVASLTVLDETGASWYASIESDTLVVTSTLPGGIGTAEPFIVLDAALQRWGLTVDRGSEALVTTPMRLQNADFTVVSPRAPYTTMQLVDSAAIPWWLTVESGAPVFHVTKPTTAQDMTPPGGPYRWLRAYDLAGTRYYISPSTAGAVVVSTTNPGGLGTDQPRTFGDLAGVRWHYGVTSGGVFAVDSSPGIDYGGMSTAICLNDMTGKRWFWRVVDGFLQWASELWPDSMDQSPWGELGWLQVTTTTSETVYVYPSPLGVPTASLGAPGPWGWNAPVTLYDADGVAWHLTVAPTTTGAPEYWQVRAGDTGSVAMLWIDAEVPATAASPPAGGVDLTPGGVPLDQLTLRDERGVRWYARLIADTLEVLTTPGTGLTVDVPFVVQDTLGQLWRLDVRLGPEALLTTLVSDRWRVRVAPSTPEALPPLTPALQLRDAVEAFAHIQPAGSLLTVYVG